jgi:hypothetical protein
LNKARAPRCLVGALLCTLIACTGSAGKRPASHLLAAGISDVTAMVVQPDGSLRIAIRASGEIEDISANGAARSAIAHLVVRSDGQRGLLGLAIDQTGRTFASWTPPDGQLVVGQVAPGPTRLVWKGPPSADLANGGHLALRNARLVVGIGDLLHNDRTRDPMTLNGKIISLDPNGPPSQTPQVISIGWNNPFAFTVLGHGDIWVADNAPGDTGERLTRGDTADDEPVELPNGTAPAGIDHLGADALAVCGYKSGRLLEYQIVRGHPGRLRTLATDCRTAVAALPDGRIAYAAHDGIRVVKP